jgi:hypothetical protein
MVFLPRRVERQDERRRVIQRCNDQRRVGVFAVSHRVHPSSAQVIRVSLFSRSISEIGGYMLNQRLTWGLTVVGRGYEGDAADKMCLVWIGHGRPFPSRSIAGELLLLRSPALDGYASEPLSEGAETSCLLANQTGWDPSLCCRGTSSRGRYRFYISPVRCWIRRVEHF